MNPLDQPVARLRHRPFGIEHPYAYSADQRVPPVPLAGESVRLGVQAEGVEAVSVEIETADAVVVMPMRAASPDAGDLVSLAGGEGHLAAAQAGSLAANGAWTIDLPIEPGTLVRYRFLARGAAPTDWFDLAPAAWEPAPVDVVVGAAERVIPGSPEWLRSTAGIHRVRFALSLAPGSHVAGFGERFDAVDQAGRHLDCVVFEQYKDQGRLGRTYLPMPFAHVVTPTGETWGFHVRTSRRVWFYVAVSDPTRLLIEVEVGSGEHEVNLGYYEGSPVDVLGAFLDEVGRAQPLPEWVFGLWASGNEWNTQKTVQAQLARHAAEQIPVSVVVIEAWSDEEGFTVFRDAQYTPHLDGTPHSAGDFTYPSDGSWPDPARMIAELHEAGTRVVLWQIPLQGTEPTHGPEAVADARLMVDRGYAVREADGSAYHNRGWWFPRALMPDFTNPEARQWWLEKRRWLVRDLGVDGFKTDGGEHAWGRDLRYADGRLGDEGNNLYAVEYAAAYGELLRSEGKAPLTFSRAGFAGSQPHGAFWAGDENSTWAAFRHSLNAGISAAACGIVYWGWDIAGFSGDTPDAELYLRATAASAFLPIMQYHSEFNHHRLPLRDRTPWNIAELTGDPRVVDQFRSFVDLRTRLRPYLVAEAEAAVTRDRPLLRALFFDWPGDQTAWCYPHEFLCGSDLLVHPVTVPGAATWTTWLPLGEWVDVWTGEPLQGETTHERPVPLETIPVYCRAEAWERLAPVFRD